MGFLTIIDTFPDFLQFWSRWHREEITHQVDGWQKDYLSQWPELLKMQINCYSEEALGWQEIARERVFPELEKRFPAMSTAHQYLAQECESVYLGAQSRLGIQFDLACILYVGIGCGAGWATTYQGIPAILFGLEMIAECGWESPESLSGLLAHELGHLAQEEWRRQKLLEDGSGPWWQLACEGFAQSCEHKILGKQTWHESGGSFDLDWLAWCRQHRGWLASQFLQRVDANETVRPFFGSWFEIEGHKQTGYYLGHEVIIEFEKTHSLIEIAQMANFSEPCRRVLEDLSRQS